MLDRGVLVAGLRALTEREAVVLIAVDDLDWDQQQLADRLSIGFGASRQTRTKLLVGAALGPRC